MAKSAENTPNGNARRDGNGSLKNQVRDITASFDQAVKQERPPAEYVLRLYVTGSTPRSLKAISNLKRVCDGNFAPFRGGPGNP